MDNPGLSLFNNGISLQFNAVNQQEREEEEDEAEEQKRIEREVAAKLDGAFDGLDLDLDDGDESSMYASYDDGRQTEMLTPGQAPSKYVTSTPFVAAPYNPYQPPEEKQFHQLALEETSFDNGAVETAQPNDPAMYGVGGGVYSVSDNVAGPTRTGRIYADAGNNPEALGTAAGPTGQYKSRTVQFTDQLNKSDTEKARDRQVGTGVGVGEMLTVTPSSDKIADRQTTTENTNLMVLYTARGREIERLEAELKKSKVDHNSEMRSLRQQLVNTAMDRQQQANGQGQLEQLLADSRRENKLLKDEIYTLKENLDSLQNEKEVLRLEHEGEKEAVTQLEQKLRQLQSTDTVLKLRQQHDAVLRSMNERHEEETRRLRSELDAAKTNARTSEKECSDLREKFVNLQNDHDYIVREKTSQIDDLSLKYAQSQQKCAELIAQDQSAELNRLTLSLHRSQELNNELEQDVRKFKTQISNLQNEIAGYEAITVEDPSDSIVAMGLSGSASQEVVGSLRLKEELHRSLNGNKSKREEIAKLEAQLTERNTQLKDLQAEFETARAKLSSSERQLAVREECTTELSQLREEVEQLRPKVVQLQNSLNEAEKQNIEVKKCMTEMLEGQNEDKMESIDSLREEYEEHCRQAVDQTKRLMEGEVRRLKIELDVYSKTVVELRKKLDLASQVKPTSMDSEAELVSLRTKLLEAEASMKRASVENDELSAKLARLVEEQRQQEAAKVSKKEDCVDEIRQGLQREYDEKFEAEFRTRFESTKQELRLIWEKSRESDIEEAVSAARLDWLKRLPELQKEGAARRESIGQLEQLRTKLSSVGEEKEQLALRLSAEKNKLEERNKELEKVRQDMASLRKDRLCSEDQLRQELTAALAKQQEQWQTILTNTRQESELQRKQIQQRLDEETLRLDDKVKKKEAERSELENRLDQVETEYGLALEKWKRVLEDKNRTIDNLKTSDQDLELLKAELARRVQEIDNQRKQMTIMAEKWGHEARKIQESHTMERKELEEVSEKYRNLKSKVRKYQRHVESKETHYKQEYTRLENEFKSTLERLRERMEQAYSAKEREVEQELGNMRHQFTEELKNIAQRNPTDQQQVYAGGGTASARAGLHFEDESLKKYYTETSKEIQQLLK